MKSSHPGYRALRKGRRSLSGHVYFVTTTTLHRNPLFSNWTTASNASRIISNPAMWQPHTCLCWVLMPDHWHGLVQLGKHGNLSAAMRTMKAESARRLARDTGYRKGIWAPGFHDHALRESDDIRAAARYIIANPVRAKLVVNVLSYPFWDAVWMDSSEQVNAPADVL